ncbi:Mitochondrial import inner membrane translocase subunit Tim21 [Trichinella pseudospiralis]|uniref:Mitochondrial import inner membrane translocase subunit Tim21 n=2 Tax=Trichinella pseudospiralis TaxID=6337 RepID=A0A0V1JPA3_TRIPS|nr:Mitochondrial import inner membrane translocase subunit Tim21 [Trichinella pseudospiralis]
MTGCASYTFIFTTDFSNLCQLSIQPDGQVFKIVIMAIAENVKFSIRMHKADYLHFQMSDFEAKDVKYLIIQKLFSDWQLAYYLFNKVLPAHSQQMFVGMEIFKRCSRSAISYRHAPILLRRVCSSPSSVLILHHHHPYFIGNVRVGMHLSGRNCSTNLKDKSLDKCNETQSSDSTVINRLFTDDERAPATPVQKIAQASKDFGYFGIVVACVAVTGVIVYCIVSELFSNQRPSKIYSNAFKLVKAHPEVELILGNPIKAYGEPITRRGRRRHVDHLEYEKDGKNYLRVKFYVEGSIAKGTVLLEMQQDENGKYDYRYMLFTSDGTPSKTVILIDNRSAD